MQADLWSGDWGLPSVDSNCLQILALKSFNKVPLKCNFSNNPWKWFTNSLPVFIHSNKHKLTNISEVRNHFKSESYNIDSHLSKKDISDINAYISMVSHKMEPCLMYLWWCDEKNYVELTRPWFAKRIPFPGNYFIPGQLQRKADETLKAMFDNMDERQIPAIVFSDAQKCMNLLSEKLLENEFFIGNEPTSLDAVVFSYLAPILKVPFPNSKQLQNHLKACNNLTKFVERVLERYFQNGKAKTEEPAEQTATVDVDFPHKWRDIILSSLFASAAMIGYSIFMGIIRISLNSEEDDDDDNEDEIDEEETT